MSILSAFIVPHPPLILPEIGHGEEVGIAKTIESYKEAANQIAALKPETIVVTSPHSIMYGNYFHISPNSHAHGDMSQFRAPGCSMEVNYDTEFVSILCKKAQAAGLPAGTEGERDPSLDHATFIPLYFLNKVYTSYKLVRIGLSGLPLTDHYRLGEQIAAAADALDRKVVFIASGDLSHKLKPDGPYGFAPEGLIFDQLITSQMAKGDFGGFLSIDPNLAEKAAECGHRSFVIMAGALDGKSVNAKLLSYEGPFGVGYGVASFFPTGTDENRHFLQSYQKSQAEKRTAIKEKEDPYVRLARQSLETYVKTGEYASRPENLPNEMLNARAGVFVSLKKDGILRGCIGTILPVTHCVADEIIQNAVSAGTSDPRFNPVREDELDELIYDVDVLSSPEPIDSPDQLNVKRYGVIVTKGGRRGLLLPNLDGVDSVDDQISIAKQKAGIKEYESVQLERFEVIRHL